MVSELILIKPEDANPDAFDTSIVVAVEDTLADKTTVVGFS
jgi:hypothetical protein